MREMFGSYRAALRFRDTPFFLRNGHAMEAARREERATSR